MDYNRFPKNPYVQKYLWRYLIETPVEIPADFDRDGVRCVFRLLDAALLSRLPHNSWLEESLNEMLRKPWPKIGGTETIDWKTLYKTEKAVNVYGRAVPPSPSCSRKNSLRNCLKAFLAASDLTRISLLPRVRRTPYVFAILLRR